jgi:hypothetical protein
MASARSNDADVGFPDGSLGRKALTRNSNLDSNGRLWHPIFLEQLADVIKIGFVVVALPEFGP